MSEAEKLQKRIEMLIRKMGTEGWSPASEELVEIGEKAVPALITVLKDESEDVRRRAAYTLGSIGENAVSKLIVALKDGDERVRYRAAEALAVAGKKAADAVPALIVALRDTNESVRRNAAWALERIGEPALQKLYEAFDRHPELSVELAAICGKITVNSMRQSGCIGTPEEHRGIRERVAEFALGSGARQMVKA